MPAKSGSFFLRCDVPDCQHEVFYDRRMEASDIGTPCPVCGSDMLTAADFKAYKRISRVMSVLEFFGLVKRLNNGDEIAPGNQLMRVHHHNGVTTTKSYPTDGHFDGR